MISISARVEVASPVRTDSEVCCSVSQVFTHLPEEEHPSSRSRRYRGPSMPLLTQYNEEEYEQYCLVASLDNVRNLSTVLKAIHFREHATCFATKNGIKVTVENAKCVQANAFIQVWWSEDIF